jgi:hypothetical protein
MNVGNLLALARGTGRAAVISTETFLKYTPIDTIFTAEISRVETGLRFVLEEILKPGSSILLSNI